MATELKRITFVVTPEMEEPLNAIKKELFYNRTQSDMIRELVSAGVRAIKEEKKKQQENQRPPASANPEQSQTEAHSSSQNGKKE